jgi:eukaryotic-like serine/threonine-protein kinase
MQATDEREAVAPALADPTLVMGRYRLRERLGSGGFGTVYAAHDERLDRAVAIKVLPADRSAPERARREALAVARLDHPGIVALFDAGEDGGVRYLVSELVEGRTLAQLEADGALSDRDVLRAGLALADALAHAHERGVIHRDVKPQNVIVPEPNGPHWLGATRAAPAKLTDFGVAHLAGEEPLTRTGDVVGTLAYMAPEQAKGRPAGEEADLYSLALVLYEALAGRHPVKGANAAATAKRVGSRIAPLARSRRDLPSELTTAIDRALHPEPALRGSLDDLYDALADALPAVSDEGGTIAPHPLERGLPALPPALGRLVAPAAAATLVALALAGLTPEPAVPIPVAALVAGVLVAVLPRAGWIAAALATVVLVGFGPYPRPGAALIVLVAVLVPPLLLRRDGSAWSLPAAAPALGLVGLSAVYPALAGRAPRLAARAALGAAGGCWIVLAEPLLNRTLLFGTATGIQERGHWDGGGSIAAGDVLSPTVSSGALLIAVVWAVAAAVLPWVVRGRSLAADVVGASAWAAALAAVTAILGQSLGDRVTHPDPRGVVAGALAAGIVAIARPWRWASHTSPMQTGGSEPTQGG